MDSTQIQSSPAVVEALEGVYDTTAPEIDPHGDPIFKVAMKTDQGIKIFEINSYEYYRLKYGMQGQLRDRKSVV